MDRTNFILWTLVGVGIAVLLFYMGLAGVLIANMW